jgi:soluble lytic murein transglycosylase-like protein
MSTAEHPVQGWRRHARAVQLVSLPLAVALVGTAAAGSTSTIRVRSGDTLSGIAAGHHTTVDILRGLNHIAADTDLIQVGQRLLIPAAAPAVARTVTPQPVAKPVPTTRIVTYVVRSGDNLTAISRHYKVAMTAVSTRNHLGKDGMIFTGQHLQIEVPVVVKNASNTFAGRTYPPATVAAANQHRASLARLGQPSQAQIRALILSTAKQWGLDPALALAVGWQESGFQQRVVSPADAIGVMQVVPSTGDYISTYLAHRRLDLLDPQDNITAGVALLRALTKAAPVDKAIAGYYQGLGSVLTRGMYADTKAYVASVQRLRSQFAG